MNVRTIPIDGHTPGLIYPNFSCRPRQRRPDRAVYVPRGRRSQTTPPTASTTATSPSKESTNQTKTNTPIANSLSTHRHATVATKTATTARAHCNNNSEIIDNRCSGNEHHQQQQQQLPQQFLISIEDPSSQVKHNCDHINNSAAALNNCEEQYFDTTIATVNMSSHKANNKNQSTVNSNNEGVPDARNSDKDYNEDKEFQRASKVSKRPMNGSANWMFN